MSPPRLQSTQVRRPGAASGRHSVNLGADHENLDQKAYQMLKSMIVERQLLPGAKIAQEKLAEDLGISRTPLINALKLLEQDKLVQSVPRRGFFVRHFNKREMISIFELREVLEGLAARRAAENITDRQIERLHGFFAQFNGAHRIDDFKAYAKEDRLFHTFLIEVGAKEFLKSILETYNLISYSYQWDSSEGLIQSPDETLCDHRAVIDAISRRDAESAEICMRRHLGKSVALLKEQLAAEGN
ncbi:MAG: GntR family transcriptional regulator [Desulfobacterales bacterium]|jgi:DNA-binding GntR family transcriptional regulator|nr:GntR family transcriptional regulator [Desulfobacterales bacterium]